MADFHLEGIDGLVQQLERMARLDDIAPKMLEEAVPLLEKSVKKEVGKHNKTGELMNSIKKTGSRLNQYGYYICVRPTGVSKTQFKYKSGRKGRRKVPVRNMEKLVYMEYGTSSQPPTPVLSKAVNGCENAVTQKMQEVFNREVETCR